MKIIRRSLRGALLTGPLVLLLDCGDSVTDPRPQTFMVARYKICSSAKSRGLDTYLELYDRDTGEKLAFNDDLDEFTADSRLSGSLPRDRYIIAAMSYDSGETGQYALTVD